MSVLAGIWNLDGAPVDQDRLKVIAQQVARYGPDGQRTYFGDAIAILFRPYYTVPESCLEQQPYTSTTGKVITWDGRLDNRDELIFELRDQLRDDRTDVAIFAAAFERWGTDCFAKILGDWAVAIWRPNSRELILARDYAGIKHLFVHRSQRRWMWSTHLAALAFGGDQFTPCAEFVAGYLAFQPDAHLTPYQEIHSVPPGHFVRIQEQRFDSQNYWTYSPTPLTSLRARTDAEYEDEFRSLFRKAVQSRLRTSGPILADLSGGLDSSSMVCMADDVRAQDGHNTTLDTFSFFDPEEPDEDDSSYLATVESKRGRTGHHAVLEGTGNSFALEFHEPCSTPGFGIRLELETAKSLVVENGNYRVLLSGNGGDQMLGQSFAPGMALADLLRLGRGREFSRELVAWSQSTRSPAAQLMRDVVLAIVPARWRPDCWHRALPLPWIRRKFARHYGMAARIVPAGIGPGTYLPSVRLRLQQLARLQGELTHSAPLCPQEIRYPFLDRRLVEFLLAIPVNQLFRRGERRSLMRRALVGIVPEEILHRRTKSGTGRCDVVTLNHHWKKVESLLCAPLSAELGYIEPGELRRALLKLKQGFSHECIGQLLRALFLEAWLRDLVDRGVLAIPVSTSARLIGCQKVPTPERADATAGTASSDLRLLAELSNPKQKGGENYAV